MIKRFLESSRYMVLVAIICSVVASAAAFIWGAWKTGLVLWNLAATQGASPLTAVRLIELMDKFLIAVGLYIFSAGLYTLFIGDLELPEWLKVRNLHEIKSRLSSILVLVMAITFLENLMTWQDPKGTLLLALAVSAIISSLLAFNRFTRQD